MPTHRALAPPAMWPFNVSPRTEDPDRLRRFLHQLQQADWQGDANAALAKTFSALEELILHEIKFYYTARKRLRVISIVTRTFSVLFGTFGVIVPLLGAADPARFKPIAPYGYPLLAAAAALLAANNLFGATGGHVRYVTAQLELERLQATFRLKWMALLAPGVQVSRDKAFELMHAFLDDAYAVMQQETAVWGKSVADGLRDYQSRLK